ncbi:TPR domain containing protein [Colletotrichum musicola]|uniref:TPR domain containing protein n=1 Tax=Colletotrichum musicola TaxID=2175873 RepID=A0A8H6MVD9_9PEZI|nr:TPR domain containing protein [Colletotrichum musicola]
MAHNLHEQTDTGSRTRTPSTSPEPATFSAPSSLSPEPQPIPYVPGSVSWARFRYTRDLSDLTEATDRIQDAITRAADDAEKLEICQLLQRMAMELLEIHRGTESTELLRATLGIARTCAGTLPPSCDRRWVAFNILAKVASRIFEHTLERDLIDEAVTALRRVSRTETPDDNPWWADLRMVHAVALCTRYTHFHNEDDINDAVRMSREAMIWIGEQEDEDKVGDAAGNHGNVLATWALARPGRWDELRDSIAFNRKAIQFCKPHKVAKWQFELGKKLRSFYMASKNRACIDEAIACTEQSLQFWKRAPGWHAWAEVRASLSKNYWYRYNYQYYKDPSDLDRSIVEMLAVCDNLTPESPGHRVNSESWALAALLFHKYSHENGTVGDLEEAIDRAMVAVGDLSPDAPSWLNDQGTVMSVVRQRCREHRFEPDTGYYLELYITGLSQRIAVGFTDASERLFVLEELAWALRLNYRLTKRNTDFLPYVTGQKDYVEALPRDSPIYIKELRRLAHGAIEAFEELDDGYIDQTIALMEAALPDVRPFVGRETLTCLDALVDLYSLRYESRRDTEDLRAAADIVQLTNEERLSREGDDGDEYGEIVDASASSSSDESDSDEPEDEEAREEEARNADEEARAREGDLRNVRDTSNEETSEDEVMVWEPSSDGNAAEDDQSSSNGEIIGSNSEFWVNQWYFMPDDLAPPPSPSPSVYSPW